MLAVLTILLLAAGADSARAPAWTCVNQVEVWCDSTSCAARPTEETTPLAVSVEANGRFSVCAYSGCWEAKARRRRMDGRLLLTAQDVPFTSGAAGLTASVTLLIIEDDGTGFVRAGGLATPLICKRAAPQ